MEIMSLQFLSALLTIIVIDLVLASDNAIAIAIAIVIVIGLAARNLPPHLRKNAVFRVPSVRLPFALSYRWRRSGC